MKRREKVYIAIVNYQQEHGYSPTIRELCDLVGLKSTSTVHVHVQKLIQEGRLRNVDFKPRTLLATDELSNSTDTSKPQTHTGSTTEPSVTVLKTEKGVPVLIKVGELLYTLHKGDSLE